MTDINSDFRLATLPEDIGRYRFCLSEENLAHVVYKPGLEFIRNVRGILADVDWDNFDPESVAAKKAFPVLVAAANATIDGREVLNRNLALNGEIVKAYSKAGAVPDSPETLRKIAFLVKPYADQMIDSLEESLHRVSKFTLSPN